MSPQQDSVRMPIHYWVSSALFIFCYGYVLMYGFRLWAAGQRGLGLVMLIIGIPLGWGLVRGLRWLREAFIREELNRQGKRR